MKKYLKDKNEIIRIRIGDSFKKQYYEYCKINGYKISERIRILLENDLKNGKQ